MVDIDINEINTKISVYDFLNNIVGDIEKSDIKEFQKVEKKQIKLYNDSNMNDFLKNYKEKIQDLYRKNINEANTKSNLIEPLFQFLGWDIHNIYEVEKEKQVISGDFVDYALKIDSKSVIYVEAKKLNDDLSNLKEISKATKYAYDDGIEWCLLTNGDKFNLYRTQELGDLNDKLVLEIKITTNLNIEYLEYFKKENIEKNILKTELNNTLITNKIIGILYGIFGEIPDKLIDYIQTKLPHLTIEQIQKALENVEAEFINTSVPKEITISEKETFEKVETTQISGEQIEIRLPGVKTADIPTWKKYNLIPFSSSQRSFFPGYKTKFTFKTDIGEIKSWVTGGSETDPVGDPVAGKYISKGISRFYHAHPDLKVGSVLIITKLQEKSYTLEIKRNYGDKYINLKHQKF